MKHLALRPGKNKLVARYCGECTKVFDPNWMICLLGSTDWAAGSATSLGRCLLLIYEGKKISMLWRNKPQYKLGKKKEKKSQLDGIHVLLRWTVNYLEETLWGRIWHPVNSGHTWHIIVTKRMKKLDLSKCNVSTIFQNDMSLQNLSKFEGEKKLKISSIT